MATTQRLGQHRVGSRRREESAVEEAIAEIDKGQQLAGHFPDSEALDRARRILTGETTPEQAREELRRLYPPIDE